MRRRARHRKLVEELRRSRTRLADAQALARVGSWEVDVARGEATWSRQLYELFGLDPTTFTPSVESFFDRVLARDRDRVVAEWDWIQHDPGERAVEARIERVDGSARWTRIVGQTLEWAEDGTPLRIGGTVQDVDELKRTELQLLDAVELNTLMQFIATAANETSTLEEALVRSRDLLLAHHDWQGAIALRPTDAGLEPLGLGGDPAPVPTAVERRTAERALAAGAPVFEEHAVPETPSIGFPVLAHGVPLVVLVITRAHAVRTAGHAAHARRPGGRPAGPGRGPRGRLGRARRRP